MRQLFLLGIPALFCSVVAAQQTSKQATSDPSAQTFFATRSAQTAKVNVISVNGVNCPVMASARRTGGGAVVQTRKGGIVEPLSELKIRFGGLAHAGISDVTISLHGTDGRPRAELAYSTSSLPEMVEVAHLSGSADHTLTSASVHPAKVVNVRWIGITDIRFMDGTEWQPSKDSWCHIEPNGFQLVGTSE